jgi:hypothetical protein
MLWNAKLRIRSEVGMSHHPWVENVFYTCVVKLGQYSPVSHTFTSYLIGYMLPREYSITYKYFNYFIF